MDEHRTCEPDGRSGRTTASEIAVLAFEMIVLLASVLCPWLMWVLWGAWLGLAGVLLGQALYMVSLKPPGICLGLNWIFTALSGTLALISIGVAAVWRAFH